MSIKIFSFEYCNKNNAIYISHNFNCHQQLFIRELSIRDIEYDTRCDYIEKHYLDNITHGIIKIKEDSFYLLINNLKEYECEIKFVNIRDFDDKINYSLDFLKIYNENEYYIEIKLNKIKMCDFIGELFRYGFFNTFYNDNQEFWVNYDILNNMSSNNN